LIKNADIRTIPVHITTTVESFLELGCDKKKGPAGMGRKTSGRCSSVVLGIRIAGPRNPTYSFLYLDKE
jgi:hypothetical protein